MRALLVGAILGLLVVPIASAQAAPPSVKCDANWTCIATAFLQGIADNIMAFFGGIASMIWTTLGGFAELIIRPFLGMFGGFFVGLGDGLKSLGFAAFDGAGDAFRSSYETLARTLESWGPFGFVAPIVAAAVIVAVLWIFAWWIGQWFSRADNLLPEGIEKVFRDQDDE